MFESIGVLKVSVLYIATIYKNDLIVIITNPTPERQRQISCQRMLLKIKI